MRTINQDISGVTPPGLDGFATRVGQAIAHTGLNQSEFARQLGVSAGFVSDVVRGQKKPGAEFLHAIRTTFGISVDWLLTGEGTVTGGSGIDLDLLHVQGEQRDTANLQLPHPRLHLRAFVLQPLAEIAPDLKIPGRGTVAAWLPAVANQGIVRL